MIKYALNHPWHFTNYQLAATSGFLQVLNVYFVEIAKVYIFLYSSTVEIVIERFVVLAIIGNIDGYFYNAVSEREAKDFISKRYNEREMCEDESIVIDGFDDEDVKNNQSDTMCFLPIQVTTSKQARFTELEANRLVLQKLVHGKCFHDREERDNLTRSLITSS